MSYNKIQNYLNQLKKVDGVIRINNQAVSDEFESFYLGVRKSEKRLLSDEKVSRLPLLKNSKHTKEWEKRARSASRLSKYFGNLLSGNVLDIGCGNGWFTGLLSRNNKLEILGMDVNLTELNQAARVFQKPNLNFLYGDIFKAQFPESTFDYITINAVIQYFKDLELLIECLFKILKPGGEIHFIDSPFYNVDELSGAKQRTIDYYNAKGFPEMSRYYFHHPWTEISKYNPVVLYNPKKKNKYLKFTTKPDMPFPWIKIIKRHG